ncbi:hypothetical protein [Micromonospora sp. NBC_01813]|uniref:hypothetical protein n=1 Tax=Micromonospora sp. NBC_01813 TaxID=2975988 RepID=UPI002DDC244E|nr:hypothetical protein [Micromonospora sp. NBC_01813]WSA11525.1 hypothetical protein OG958_12505 [Micromonospora sp. NBC_01813]
MQKITPEDITVVLGTSPWGGPAATVTVNAGPLAGRSFWLRSTQGLDNDVTDSVARGGGIHLYATDPDKPNNSIADWRGAFKTFSMRLAIEHLVDEVNDLAVRAALYGTSWAELIALGDAIGQLGDALGERSQLDWRKEWQRVLDAVAGMSARIAEVDN